ncbi:MAG: dienelactone hydrolase family protein [Deltaproteobacteria bacterium]|nr:dienelactone hydrolase family protein [Deltaproteobacteria bacterium]MBW2696231.1 dienelactone hydrolase family protein [Deltaproteobacteria bacterium]
MLEGFEKTSFTHDGRTRPVHTKGQGPGVVVVHEIPGIYPAVAEFADRVLAVGFRVGLPELFGRPGREYSGRYSAGPLARACIRREFHVLAFFAERPRA